MRQRLILAALLMGLGAPALSADWTTIIDERTRRIEIDRDSVLQSDPGTKVAWGRIVLSADDANEAGYAVVKALNRYDCRSRSFATVKRVYLDAASRVIREERVVEQRAIQVNPRSVDERLWYEVCKPPKAADIAELAAEASRAAEAVKPTAQDGAVRHADMQDTAKEQAEPVRTAEPAHGAAETHQAPAPGHEELKPGSAQPGHDMVTEGQIELPKRPTLRQAPAPKPTAEAADTHEAQAPTAEAVAPEATIHATPPAPKKVVERAAPPRPTRASTRSAPVRKPARSTKPAKPALLKVAMKEEAHGEPASAAMAHKDIHWGYEGAEGPANWAKLNPAWKTCEAGKRQSPIDIRDGIGVDLTPIEFNYTPTYFRILNNGHTVQVSVGRGSRIEVMGRSFDLVQFHFHRPSEERVNGRGFEMVAHLVHRDLDGRLAVVAVLIERGQPHSLVQTLWNNLPLEQHHDYAPPGVSIDPRNLLPASPDYYTYMGSLTTPPCSEDVLWMVMKEPIQLSDDQIAIFARLYPNNARPVQPSNDRLIKASR